MFGDAQVRKTKQGTRLAVGLVKRNEGVQGLRWTRGAVGTFRCHRTIGHHSTYSSCASVVNIGINRIRVAATVEQEVFILHVSKGFRVEGHADEVEVRV